MTLLDKRIEVFTIPIFPLPACVFFPHTMLPLHIFETRYRAMIADALAGKRQLAVVMLQPGHEADYHGRPPVYSMAGAGIIVGDEHLKDGRYNLMLQGVTRVEILEEIEPERPYRMARVRRVEDRYPGGDPERLRVEAETLKRIFTKLVESLPEAPDSLIGMAAGSPSPGALADEIAGVTVQDPAVKQHLLESLDVAERLDTVTDVVSRLLFHVMESAEGAVVEDDDDDDDGSGGSDRILH